MVGRVQGKNVPVGITHTVRNYAVTVIVLNVVLTFVFGASLDINNYAHIGGLIAGALLGCVLPPLRSIGGRDHGIVEKIVLWGAIAFSAVALLFAVLNLAAAIMHPPPAHRVGTPVGGRLGSDRALARGIAPETLEVVEGPLAGEEDVRDHGVEVGACPRRVLEPGDRERAHPVRLADVGDTVSDGTNLTVGVALADHEIVGDGRLAADVEDDHVTRLLVGGGGGDDAGQFGGGHPIRIMHRPDSGGTSLSLR